MALARDDVHELAIVLVDRGDALGRAVFQPDADRRQRQQRRPGEEARACGHGCLGLCHHGGQIGGGVEQLGFAAAAWGGGAVVRHMQRGQHQHDPGIGRQHVRRIFGHQDHVTLDDVPGLAALDGVAAGGGREFAAHGEGPGAIQHDHPLGVGRMNGGGRPGDAVLQVQGIAGRGDDGLEGIGLAALRGRGLGGKRLHLRGGHHRGGRGRLGHGGGGQSQQAEGGEFLHGRLPSLTGQS